MKPRVVASAALLACVAAAAAGAPAPSPPALHASRPAPSWSRVAPFPPPAHPGTLHYTISVPTLERRTLHVSLQVSGWTAPTLRLRGVPRYLDNPTPAGAGQVMGAVRAYDREGRALPVRRRSAERGNSRYDVAVRDGAVRVEYDLRVAFANSGQTSRYPIQIPFMAGGRAWLYGNCVFAAPEVEGGERRALRAPLDLRVRFGPGPGIALVGPDSTSVRVPNVYALLSLQFGFGRFHVEPVPSADARISIAIPDTAQFSPAERRALRHIARRVVGCVGRFFGQTPYPSTTFYFFRRNGMGGQEGAFALQCYAPPGLALTDSTGRAGVFRRVALHEYFHTWTPIALFGHDDPWIKEGLTSYYGDVLSARLGWWSAAERTHWFDRFEKFAAANPRLHQVPLSDPRIWDHEYDDETWRSLTYERGMAATLLLDVWIREQTQNAQSLDDVMRLLAARFAHGTFGHAELLAAVTETAGTSPAAWFARWVDGTEVPDRAALQAALARATEFGVFEPGGVPVAPTR